jgi:recombination protein RecR
MVYSEPIINLIKEFSKLPGVGEKTAQRLAFYLINQPKEEATRLATAIKDLKDKIISCSICCNISCEDPCMICVDPRRDKDVICVVEQSNDLWAIESSGTFRGTYHVLGGRIAPLDGVSPEDLTIRKLLDRIRRNSIKEIIFATNPTVEGDATAYYIRSLLNSSNGHSVRITRIAKGIPEGSSIEYVNKFTVSSAISGRQELQ